MKNFYFIFIDREGNKDLYRGTFTDDGVDSLMNLWMKYYVVVDYFCIEDWPSEEDFARFIKKAYGVNIKKFYVISK